MLPLRRLLSTARTARNAGPASREQVLAKLRASPVALRSMVKLIDALESKGLTSERAPSPEEWQQMMTDDGVQAAIHDFGKACDEAGVPPDANVMSALMAQRKEE